MNATSKENASFRHSIRSELNQIIGYAELLAQDQAAAIGASAIEKLIGIQRSARRVLQGLQMAMASTEVQASRQGYLGHSEIAEPIREIQSLLAELLNELPAEYLVDLQSIQSALLALGDLLDHSADRPSPVLEGIRAKSIFLDSPYSASIPAELELRGRLLVIDDSEANLRLIERQLQELGLEVVTAIDATSGLAALMKKPFDCVLLDMVIPNMDGPALLGAIRANPEWSGIPVLMLSALDEVHEAARCIQIGAEDYLVRPIELPLLRAKLHSTIQRRYLYEDCQKLGRDLAEKNEELRRFVMVTSHDLQSPLRTIESNLRSVSDEMRSDPAKAQALLEESLNRCKGMHNLIQDLLVYARMGQIEPYYEEIDLGWVFVEAIANLQGEIEASGAEIIRHSLPTVNVDFKQMLHLFQNLIANAIRYRSELTPRIEVGAQERRAEWIVYFRDNGQGIPQDQHIRIFEPFHRLHGDQIPGTGLGLAIAKRAAEQSGGRLWVHSAPGAGATFFLALPKIN